MWFCIHSLQSQEREKQILWFKKHGKQTPLNKAHQQMWHFHCWRYFLDLQNHHEWGCKSTIFTDTFMGKVKAYIKQFRMPLVWGKEKCVLHSDTIVISLNYISPQLVIYVQMFYKLASSLLLTLHTQWTSLRSWGLASNQINKYDFSGFYFHY